MAYFVELDQNNVVLRTIVVHEEDASNGEFFCHNLFGGIWLETFVDGSQRKQYASPNYFYDAVADVFISPKPFESWSLDENYDWQAPIDYPADGKDYLWDEANQAWVEFPAI
jgi:hypothetical protein